MRPVYALTSRGTYLALHLGLWFYVARLKDAPGFQILCGAPGAEEVEIYTWSAYPDNSDTETDKDGNPITMNELAAEEMLKRIMLLLLSEGSGLIDVDELAAEIVDGLGLEATQ